MMILLYCRTIVLFAGERIFKIGIHLAKLQAKWFDCFTCPVWNALSCLKEKVLPGKGNRLTSDEVIVKVKGWRFLRRSVQRYLYSKEPDQLCFTISEVAVDWWCRSAMLQLQHAPRPQSTTPGLHHVRVHQMAPPVRCSTHLFAAYYSFIHLKRMKGWVGLVFPRSPAIHVTAGAGWHRQVCPVHGWHLFGVCDALQWSRQQISH